MVAVVMMIMMAVAGTGTAAMTHSAITILQAAMTIAANHDTLTIDGSAAGTAGVGVASAGMTMVMAIASLAGGGGESSKAGDRDCQEGDDLFHEGGRRLFGFVAAA